MDPRTSRDVLHPNSRLNFGKPTPVEHNLRVQHIGDINPQHLDILLDYFKAEYQGMVSCLSRLVTTATLPMETLGNHPSIEGMTSLAAPLNMGYTSASPGMDSSFRTEWAGSGQVYPNTSYTSILPPPIQDETGPESQPFELFEQESRPGDVQYTKDVNDTGLGESAQGPYQSTEMQRFRGYSAPESQSVQREPRGKSRPKSEMTTSTKEVTYDLREQKKAKGHRKGKK
jgi:hypothetical protein